MFVFHICNDEANCSKVVLKLDLVKSLFQYCAQPNTLQIFYIFDNLIENQSLDVWLFTERNIVGFCTQKRDQNWQHIFGN